MLETRDRAWIEARLRREPVWGAYALGDLDDAEFDRTRWFASDESGAALVLRYEAFGNVTLMTFGEGDATASLLPQLPLPESFHLHHPETQREALTPLLDGDLQRYARLGVRRQAFVAPRLFPGIEIVPLTMQDVPDAQALYRHYPANWFAPERVVSGCYLGAFDAGRLIAVAGTHVVSRTIRVAALGDIVTAPERRGRGVGAAITGALCSRLFVDVDLIVLNVLDTNEAAYRCYAKLGFGDAVAHYEGFDVRRRGR